MKAYALVPKGGSRALQKDSDNRLFTFTAKDDAKFDAGDAYDVIEVTIIKGRRVKT